MAEIIHIKAGLTEITLTVNQSVYLKIPFGLCHNGSWKLSVACHQIRHDIPLNSLLQISTFGIAADAVFALAKLFDDQHRFANLLSQVYQPIAIHGNRR